MKLFEFTEKAQLAEDEPGGFDFGPFSMYLPQSDHDAEQLSHALGAAGFDPWIETALQNNDPDIFHKAALDLKMIMPGMENYLMSHLTDEGHINAWMADIEETYHFMRGGYKKYLHFADGKWQHGEEDLNETIKKHGSGYRVVSHTGKNLGDEPTKAAAEKRLRQVEYFKHKNEDVDESRRPAPKGRIIKTNLRGIAPGWIDPQRDSGKLRDNEARIMSALEKIGLHRGMEYLMQRDPKTGMVVVKILTDRTTPDQFLQAKEALMGLEEGVVEGQVNEVGDRRTTALNPLVTVWEGPESIGYDYQGLVGHLNLKTEADIAGFAATPKLAQTIIAAGPGKRTPVKGKYRTVYLELSQHHEGDMSRQAELGEGAADEWKTLKTDLRTITARGGDILPAGTQVRIGTDFQRQDMLQVRVKDGKSALVRQQDYYRAISDPDKVAAQDKAVTQFNETEGSEVTPKTVIELWKKVFPHSKVFASKAALGGGVFFKFKLGGEGEFANNIPDNDPLNYMALLDNDGRWDETYAYMHVAPEPGSHMAYGSVKMRKKSTKKPVTAAQLEKRFMQVKDFVKQNAHNLKNVPFDIKQKISEGRIISRAEADWQTRAGKAQRAGQKFTEPRPGTKAAEKAEMRALQPKKVRPKKEKPNMFDIAMKVSDAFGQSFPDGDPYDYLGSLRRKLERMGYDPDKVINKAVRQELGAKNLDAYFRDSWQETIDDNPEMWGDIRNPWK